MCDQTTIHYKQGDIVWVKLGSCWWPGEVHDLNSLPKEWLSDFKKPPLAAVKFFEEDKYEYVKSIEKIYSYNCAKKNEFIKKGLDLYRAKNAFMKKFPNDVSTAETKTGGNPNIIEDPTFEPEKKTNYAALLFGTPQKGKRGRKSLGSGGRKSSSSTKSSPAASKASNITHPRFLERNDHEVRILVQPKRNTETSQLQTENYKCSSCGFKTTRIDVFVFHNKSHIQGVYSTPIFSSRKPKKLPKKEKKLKMTRSKTSTIMEDLELIDKGIMFGTESSDDSLEDWDVEELTPKRRRRKVKRKPKKVSPSATITTTITSPSTITDIRSDLLAEWGEDSESEEENTPSVAKAESDVSISKEESAKPESNEKDEKTEVTPNKDKSKSCFDFDDEEESEQVVGTSPGRKIPRVIPQSNKQTVVEENVESLSNDSTASDKIDKVEKVETVINISEKKHLDSDFEAFNDILKETSVPVLPDLIIQFKSEQDNVKKAVQLQDKPENESPNTSTTKEDNLTSIQENLETLPAEVCNNSILENIESSNSPLSAVSTEDNKTESKTSESLPKVEPPAILKDCPETVLSSNIEEVTDTLKKPDVELEIGHHTGSIEGTKMTLNIQNTQMKLSVDINEPSNKLPAKDQKELAAKLINPKKRFVKSFEDFEQQLSNENNMRAELLKSTPVVEESQPKASVSIEQPVIVKEDNSLEAPKGIEVSKLKIQLKSKLESSEKNILNSNKKAIGKSPTASKPSEKSKSSPDSQNNRSHLIEWLATKNKGPSASATTSTPEKSVVLSSHPVADLSESSNVPPKEDKLKVTETSPIKHDLKTIVPTSQENELVDVAKNQISESKDVPSVSTLDEISDKNVYSVSTSEDLSALSTLAAVSELTTNLEMQTNRFEENIFAESSLLPKPNISNIDLEEKSKIEGGCLTYVTEDVLADNQVEITNGQPVTLSSFSVDFSEQIASDCQAEQTVEQTCKLIHKEEEKRSEVTPDITLNVLSDNKIDKDVYASTEETENSVQVSIPEYTSTSKLLEILTDGKSTEKKMESSQKSSNIGNISNISNRSADLKTTSLIKEPVKTEIGSKNSKFIIKSAALGKQSTSTTKSTKPIILSDQSIKPISETESVSVQKVISKRVTQNVEDIDTFIIQKHAKRPLIAETSEEIAAHRPIKKPNLGGKAKILQQTIIKPDGDIIQPINTMMSTSKSVINEPSTSEENVFDINSMPIVLGDQILTTECIENIPVSVSNTSQSTSRNPPTQKIRTEPVKLLNKTASQLTPTSTVFKTYSQKLVKTPKIFQTTVPKITKPTSAVISRPGKTEKFIIVPPGSNTSTQSKYTLAKKSPLVKKPSVVMPSNSPNSATKVQNPTSEPSGNKIMIVTNQQGQQSRVLLTPAQQKYLGYQSSGTKSVKSALKGNILQKSANIKSTIMSTTKNIKTPSMVSHAIINSAGEIISASNPSVTSDGQVLMSLKSSQLRSQKSELVKTTKRLPSQKVLIHDSSNTPKVQHKTVVIKNQQGQVIRRIQSTDDALLEQQVAEQVQAIKASGSFNAIKNQQEVNSRLKPVIKRSYPKKLPVTETTSKAHFAKIPMAQTPAMTQVTQIPPLAPISPKRSENVTMAKVETKAPEPKPEPAPQKPLNQLIIQDSLGNQTTITEGQILALPSGETVDGQPQSYMLVTLDESGNLTPLNNEALLSLDPNLCLGGDLSNMVLQIDEGANKGDVSHTAEVNTLNCASLSRTTEIKPDSKKEQSVVTNTTVPKQLGGGGGSSSVSGVPKNNVQFDNSSSTAGLLDNSRQSLESVQTVTCNIGNDPNQQLIITGDPVSTQKFIESLTEGNQDLANLLASAEGNILIQTDEQQILINAESNNQILLPMSNDNLNVSEGQGNPIFATQSNKSQDILAAALADTDVFQSEHTTQSKIVQSQLSPSGGLFPPSVANVLETTLSLSSPIMTPLEVPSSNNKKIPDEETDLLTTEVPKNVDLPITITDPNISQTVAQQQVASLIANELSTNLELPLAITDTGPPLTSSDMNSPYVYSLPSLDESVDIHQKAFTTPMSMPLLNEEPQVDISNTNETDDSKAATNKILDTSDKHLTSSVETERNNIFEPNNVLTKDEKESIDTPFLTNMDSEEGLCTLGGAMCSSLSEPPPDMFDLSLDNNSYSASRLLKEQTSVVSAARECSSTLVTQHIKSVSNIGNSTVVNEQANLEEFEKFDTFDSETRNDSTPLSDLPINSESNSPAINIDESSSEIPLQPQIVTDLSSSASVEKQENTQLTQINKRPLEDITEDEVKKTKLD